jgi:uncharacterized protein (UPF0248 family)
MVGKVVEQKPADLTVDPHSELVELSQACDNVALDINRKARDEEEHGQSDVMSEEGEMDLKRESRENDRTGRQKDTNTYPVGQKPQNYDQREVGKLVADVQSGVCWRGAIDILNRIQWDPTFKREDFVIGYAERFEGIKEISFGLWLRESSEENFVPQHRIRYFKKRQNEKVVWSRDDRVDKVFGSGVGAGILDNE